jgi:hypothetical protein
MDVLHVRVRGILEGPGEAGDVQEHVGLVARDVHGNGARRGAAIELAKGGLVRVVAIVGHGRGTGEGQRSKR